MSVQPRDDTERDVELTALYRAAPHDGPPAALDDAIRAAARRAVASRPRLASSPFSRSWRVPLSVAAMLVLSVSLVTLMRDEAPEITSPQGLDLSRQPSAAQRPPSESARTNEVETRAPGASVSDHQTSSSLGLRPSSPSSAGGLRGDPGAVASDTKSSKTAAAERQGTQALSAPSPAGHAASEAFPGVPMRNEAVAPGAQPGQSGIGAAAQRDIASSESRRTPAAPVAPAESKTQGTLQADNTVHEAQRGREHAASLPQSAKSEAVAAAKPPSPPQPPITLEKPVPQSSALVQSYADQPPEKWLEQIEALRKQGRLEEAKANLEAFTRRYPRYELPPALKEWARP